VGGGGDLNSYPEYIYIIGAQTKHEIHFHNFMVKAQPPPLWAGISDGINDILLPPFVSDSKPRGGV
jgi:hypothetical protein